MPTSPSAPLINIVTTMGKREEKKEIHFFCWNIHLNGLMFHPSIEENYTTSSKKKLGKLSIFCG